MERADPEYIPPRELANAMTARVLRGAVAVVAILGAAPGCADRESRAPEPSRAPVFVLGFDGLDPGMVEGLIDEGLLPNFARLRHDGAWGTARSTIPFVSPPAWATVATGTAPSDHGIWSFWVRRGDDPRGTWVDARARLAPAIWEELSDLGRTVGVVNVPVTCPPDTVRGFLISGMPFPTGADLAWPPELGDEIESRGYLRESFGGPPEPGREEEWLDRLEQIADARRRLALGLLFERSPDFSFIVFTLPDRVQHHLWKFHDPKHPHFRADASPRLREAVRNAYRWCDDVLGEVRERLPADACLLVVSDHGFGPAYAGITKQRVLADWPRDEAVVAGSQNLFGGDFFLEEANDDESREFAEFLARLSSADGRSLVRDVVAVCDLPVRGYGTELGPDVVAFEAEGFLFAPGRATDPLVTVLPVTAFSGYHRRDGFFAACGPQIAPGARVAVDLHDIPAWAMHVLGEAVPGRYVSDIPTSIFAPALLAARSVSRAGSPTEGFRRPGEASTIDSEIQAQLEALGYVR